MTVEAILDFGSPNPPREPLESCLALDIILLETADILVGAAGFPSFAAGVGVAAGEGVLDGVVGTFSMVSLGFPSSAHIFNLSCGYLNIVFLSTM